MKSVPQTLELIERQVPPLPSERVPLDRAQGRVLRETIVAPDDLPAFDRASMDGFAVRRDDPGPVFLVVDEIRAGQTRARKLQPGQAVRIFTGAALPGEGLQVVMQEDTATEGDKVTVHQRRADLNIRMRGEDARRGETLMAAGTRLGAGELSLLASLGHVLPQVGRQPKAAHFTTGDELVPPAETPGPGQIRDSNSILVQALLRERGICVRPGRLPEAFDGAWSRLQEHGVDDVDLLLISGGASVGRHDCTADLLERLGYELLVRKVDVRPGKPLLFGVRGPQVAFGLPGNPLSHLVCFHLFVAAAIRRLEGLPAATTLRSGTMAEAVASGSHSRETYWPAVVREGAGGWEVRLRAWRSSGDVTALPGIEALVRIPAGTGAMRQGSRVDFLPTRQGG